MGVIGLLTLPITGVARFGWWVVDQVIDAADDELHDEDRIVAELRRLAADFDAGRIDEREYASAEAHLLRRLSDAWVRGRAIAPNGGPA